MKLAIAGVILVVTFVLGALTIQAVSWLMAASGYNCMMRKIGYENGVGLDDPPATSKHCEGHHP